MTFEQVTFGLAIAAIVLAIVAIGLPVWFFVIQSKLSEDMRGLLGEMRARLCDTQVQLFQQSNKVLDSFLEGRARRLSRKTVTDIDAVRKTVDEALRRSGTEEIKAQLAEAQQRLGQLSASMDAIAGSALQAAVGGGGGGTANVETGSTKLGAGAKAVVPLMAKRVNAVYGLAAYDLSINFNPRVVRVDSVQPGNGPFSAPQGSRIDNRVGEVTLAGFQVSELGLKGDVTIAQLLLTAVGRPGSATRLEVTARTLFDSMGNEIASTAVSGTVTIV